MLSDMKCEKIKRLRPMKINRALSKGIGETSYTFNACDLEDYDLTELNRHAFAAVITTRICQKLKSEKSVSGEYPSMFHPPVDETDLASNGHSKESPQHSSKTQKRKYDLGA